MAAGLAAMFPGSCRLGFLQLTLSFCRAHWFSWLPLSKSGQSRAGIYKFIFLNNVKYSLQCFSFQVNEFILAIGSLFLRMNFLKLQRVGLPAIAMHKLLMW